MTAITNKTAEASVINCIFQADMLICNGTEFTLRLTPLTYLDHIFWMYLIMYIVLTIFAGIVIFSVDYNDGTNEPDDAQENRQHTVGISVKESGSRNQKKHVARILPLVRRHHLLLVTLLLSNAVAVETMPIFLDRISNPLTAVLVSVTVVLFFGELVYLLIGMCFVVTYPIAKLLDCMLGCDNELLFGKAELKVLVDLLSPGGMGGKDELTFDEVLIIKGALELGDKTVKDAMVSLENVFMLDIESKLDNETINKVIEAAHSRIPIYEGCPENIVAVLLVKTLIAVCNQAEQYDVFRQKGLAASVVSVSRRSFRFQNACGIITLEDVLEELLQEDIIDETDVYVDVRNGAKIAGTKLALTKSLPLFSNASTKSASIHLVPAGSSRPHSS
ncbi:hypothetical protein LSH36_623g01065 [Paralvinella palmiformis]|uniref:CNNM transmembrane domain-containing protein n=1 Tax=Paralvinella palmiformis TaxID=53620 RepID=A0AAD9J4G5_9ANNE|nr:hypothetical protein LSH36_623g01065 [Paralvinella palmiformis]